MERQKFCNSQHNTEKEQNDRTHTNQFKTYYEAA